MDYLLLSSVHKCTFCSGHLTKILIEVVFYEQGYLNFSTICQIRSVLTFTFSPLCPYATPFFSLLSFLKKLCRCFKSQVPFSNEIRINIAMVQSKPNNTWCKYNESVCCQRTRAKMDINYHRQWVSFPKTNQLIPSTHYSGFHFGQLWGLILWTTDTPQYTSYIRDLALFAWPLAHIAHPCMLFTACATKVCLHVCGHWS